jgi:hypothetical protein
MFEIDVPDRGNKKANQVRIGSASIGKKQNFAVYVALNSL